MNALYFKAYWTWKLTVTLFSDAQLTGLHESRVSHCFKSIFTAFLDMSRCILFISGFDLLIIGSGHEHPFNGLSVLSLRILSSL